MNMRPYLQKPRKIKYKSVKEINHTLIHREKQRETERKSGVDKTAKRKASKRKEKALEDSRTQEAQWSLHEPCCLQLLTPQSWLLLCFPFDQDFQSPDSLSNQQRLSVSYCLSFFFFFSARIAQISSRPPGDEKKETIRRTKSCIYQEGINTTFSSQGGKHWAKMKCPPRMNSEKCKVSTYPSHRGDT